MPSEIVGNQAVLLALLRSLTAKNQSIESFIFIKISTH